MEDVLRAVVKARFALGLRKCNFAVSEMVWCGFHLSAEGRRPDPERTRAFLEMGTPANKAELGRWVGVAGALRTGVPYFVQLAAPLYKRMPKAAPRSVVDEEYLEQLEAVRDAVRSAPPLADPVPGAPLTVEVDGSTIGYGAVLRQNGKMCATASRQKTKAELNYGSFDNEWGALMFGIEAFRFWLAGRSNTLVDTDLKGLTENDLDVHAHEDRTGRRARWVDTLSHFPHTLRWRPREQMVVSDALAKSPAFRAPVLALREEARERQRSATVASGRGE